MSGGDPRPFRTRFSLYRGQGPPRLYSSKLVAEMTTEWSFEVKQKPAGFLPQKPTKSKASFPLLHKARMRVILNVKGVVPSARVQQPQGMAHLNLGMGVYSGGCQDKPLVRRFVRAEAVAWLQVLALLWCWLHGDFSAGEQRIPHRV